MIGTWADPVQFKVVGTTTGKAIAMKNVARSREQRVSVNDAIPALPWDVESVSVDLDREVVRGFLMAIAPIWVSPWDTADRFPDDETFVRGVSIPGRRFRY